MPRFPEQLLFFKGYDGNACVSLAELTQMIFLHNLAAAQIIVYGFSECTGSFSVNDTDRGKVGDISVIQIFIQLRNGFI